MKPTVLSSSCSLLIWKLSLFCILLRSLLFKRSHAYFSFSSLFITVRWRPFNIFFFSPLRQRLDPLLYLPSFLCNFILLSSVLHHFNSFRTKLSFLPSLIHSLIHTFLSFPYLPQVTVSSHPSPLSAAVPERWRQAATHGGDLTLPSSSFRPLSRGFLPGDSTQTLGTPEKGMEEGKKAVIIYFCIDYILLFPFIVAVGVRGFAYYVESFAPRFFFSTRGNRIGISIIMIIIIIISISVWLYDHDIWC